MSEHTAGRAASDHHQVREADVVENRDVARRHARAQPLLPEVDRAHRLEREAVGGEQKEGEVLADERSVGSLPCAVLTAWPPRYSRRGEDAARILRRLEVGCLAVELDQSGDRRIIARGLVRPGAAWGYS